MRTQFSKFFAVLTFMVIGLFIACGGGGGGSNPAPPPAPSTYSISGTVSGSVTAGVSVSIAPTPAGVSPWVTTDSKGFYAFANIPNGTFVLTPYISGHTFTPATATIVVNGANVTGINFNSPLSMLNTGKLLYYGQDFYPGVYQIDLATGVEKKIWWTYAGVPGIPVPDLIVPLRGTGLKAAFRNTGTTYGDSGIWNLNLVDGTKTYAVPSATGGEIAIGYPSQTLGSFDVGLDTRNGNFAACTLQSTAGKKDIFLVLMNSSWYNFQVTTDGFNTSPVVGSVNTTGDTTLFFLKNGNEVWKATMNTVNTLPNLVVTLYKTSAMDSTRPMSVSADYTLLAWTKNVSGVGHIIVTSLAGGTDLDLGPGSDPSWSLNGNGMLLFNTGGALWAVNADGTGRIQVPTPSKMVAGALATVVFGPAGF